MSKQTKKKKEMTIARRVLAYLQKLGGLYAWQEANIIDVQKMQSRFMDL